MLTITRLDKTHTLAGAREIVCSCEGNTVLSVFGCESCNKSGWSYTVCPRKQETEIKEDILLSL